MEGTKIEAFGKLYTSGDIKVRLLNLSPDGIDGVKYGVKQEKTNVFTMGTREPVARIHKQKEYEASLTVKMFVLDALERAATKGDITSIKPFQIGVTMLDENEAVIKHDNLVYCEFTGTVREFKNDNNEPMAELELAIGGIDRNV